MFINGIKHFVVNDFIRFLGNVQIFLVMILILAGKSNQECENRYPELYCININQNNLNDSLTDISFKRYLYSSERLTINHSTIEILSSKMSVGTNFKEMYLKNLNIARIVPKVFNGLDNLKVLDLSHNELRTIKSNTFYKLSSLKNLSLQNNHIEDIEDHAFISLSRLLHLLLNNNEIRQLPVNVFDSLLLLEYLDLSSNQIEAVDKAIFLANIQLKYVYLNNNRIIHISDELFKNNIRLKSIDISLNPLEKPLNYNIFSRLTELTDLGVSSTENRSVFHLNQSSFESLRKLKMDGNSLNQVNIDIHPNLTFVSLSRNNIDYINSSLFKNCKNVQYLNLSFNKIFDIQVDAFDRLIKLKVLDLKSNKLSVLKHGIFKNLSNLEHLDLSSNYFKTIPYGTLDSLKKLIFLSLSYNEFSILDIYMFHSLRNLEELHLNANNFNFIDGSVLVSTLPALNKIALDKNLWTCSKLMALVHILEKNSISILDGSSTHTHNINGIECEDVITIDYSKPMNHTYSDGPDLSKVYEFFNTDFKNTNFYKFFMNRRTFEINTKPSAEKVVRTVHVNATTKEQDDIINEQHEATNFEVLYILMILTSVTNILVVLYVFYRLRYLKMKTNQANILELGSSVSLEN
nr:leucine-rich repeat-containing protein 15-like [Leptinotarsa decemlineata]